MRLTEEGDEEKIATRAFLDYFYGGESEQFQFFRIPQRLVTDAAFRHISSDAKLLYGMMLDRMGLSAKNGWYDDLGRVYIYYPLEEIQKTMCCGHDKATRILNELDVERGIGLIERVRQGLGKPARIYVKKFVSREIPVRQSRDPECGKIANQSAEKSQSGLRPLRAPECEKLAGNHIDIIHTEKNQLYPSIDPSYRESCLAQIAESIEYEWLQMRLNDEDMKLVDELMGIMADAICTTRSTLRIGGSEIPAANVRARLQMIGPIHIEYVLDSFNKTTSRIKDIHAYLLTALYRAPTTINHYYQAAVQHDMFGDQY